MESIVKKQNMLVFTDKPANRQTGESKTSPLLPFPGSSIRYIAQRFLILLMVVCAVLTPEWASAQVRAGGAFLKIIPGVRNHGLAGSYTGVIDEMHTIYANPGAAGFLREWQWATSYTRWIADSYHLSGLYGKRFTTPWSDKTRFVLGIHYQGVGDFNSTGDPAQAEVGANDALFSLSIGNPLSFLSKNISFGTNIKFLRSQLASESATSWMFDFGLMYKSNRFRMNFLNFEYGILSAGVSANHLGQPLNFIGTDTPLPRSFRAGAALNVGSHSGMQIQFSADYSKFRDEVDRFSLGAEVFLGNLIGLRGGYNFNDNELTGIAAGLSIKLGNSPALPVGKNNAIRFDLAQWESNTFFVTPLRVGVNHFPVGPEKFNLIDDIYAGESRTINEPVNLSWQASRDPDLYDDVNNVLLLAKDSDGFALRELVTKTRKDPDYLLNMPVTDSLYKNALDVLTQENGSTGGIITFKFPNESDPNIVTRMVDIRWFKGFESDRKGSELSYLLKPEPQHEPGIYLWTVLAYDRDRHVRFAEGINHFWITDSLYEYQPIIVIADLELTSSVKNKPFKPDVNFNFGDSTLTDNAKHDLDILASALLTPDLKDKFIHLYGHTDQVGSDRINMVYSKRRANRVRRYLISKGIDSKRIVAVGHGESKPLKDAISFLEDSAGVRNLSLERIHRLKKSNNMKLLLAELTSKDLENLEKLHKANRRVEVFLLTESSDAYPPADNLIIKAVSPGNPVTYNLTILNKGPQEAQNFTIFIDIPPLAELIPNSLKVNTPYDSKTLSDSFSLQFKSLAPGASIDIQYDLNVKTAIPQNPYKLIAPSRVKGINDVNPLNNNPPAGTVYIIGKPASAL